MRTSNFILATLFATSVSAQEVTGIVRAESGNTPVAGAIVILTAQGGTRVGATLAADDGRYRLRAPAAGMFALRVDVVGYESVILPSFRIDATVTRDIVFPFARVRLPAVAVTAASACARVSSDAGD